jgi:hypothetical protein
MKNHTKWICVLVGPALLGATSLWAQDAGQGQAQAPMVEIYGCNFIGDANMEDLIAVSNRWNDWADRHGYEDYMAALLTPIMYSNDLTADVFWLGSSSNGDSFGAELGTWITEGSDMQAEFMEILDCQTHMLFGEWILREPEGPIPDSPVLSFQNCTLQPGRNISEAIGAGGRWANYVATNGHDVFMSQLYPSAGLPSDASYAFKGVMGHESAAAYGRFLSTMTGNSFAGAGVAFAINSPFYSCDSARVYSVRWVRTPETS